MSAPEPPRSAEAQLQAMERERNAILARRTRALLAAWNEDMSAMRCEQDSLLAEGRWVTGPSDFLGIVRLARDENTHSRMLEWLLTPTARHGLGCGFVRRIVRHCGGPPVMEPSAVRRVAFSVWRNAREADVVAWRRDFTLVIENKVDALEQPNQCDDLYANFRGEKGPRFLFLTPDGRRPDTATNRGSKSAFRTLAWPRLRAMLEGAARESAQTAPAGDVVRNYLRTLREQFG